MTAIQTTVSEIPVVDEMFGGVGSAQSLLHLKQAGKQCGEAPCWRPWTSLVAELYVALPEQHQ
jgi:hypothetical protein